MVEISLLKIRAIETLTELSSKHFVGCAMADSGLPDHRDMCH